MKFVRCLVLLIVLISGLAFSQPFMTPPYINYHGYLSKEGMPYNGDTNITINVYAFGVGAPVYTFSSNDVPIFEGVYNLRIPIPYGALMPTNDYRFEVLVDGTPVTSDIDLISVPYAYYAGRVHWSNIIDIPDGFDDGQDDTSNLWNMFGGGVYYNAGIVGIGTSSPSTTLHVAGTGTFDSIDTGSGAQELYGRAGDLLSGTGISISGGGNDVLYGPDGDITVSVANDSLDFAQFVDVMSLDATTEINLGSYNLNIDLSGTGDFHIRDGAASTHIFYDNGDVRLGPNTELYVDNALNSVGIGTASPAGRLHSVGSGGPALVVTRATGYPSIRAASDWLILDSAGSGSLGLNYYSGNNVILAQGGGWVGVGGAPGCAFDVASGEVQLPGGGGGTTHFNYSGNNQNYIRGTTIIADSGGRLGVRTASPATDIHLLQSDASIAGAGGMMFDYSGDQWRIMHTGSYLSFILNGTRYAYIERDGDWFVTSDARVKENIKALGSTLDKVVSLEPVSYNLKHLKDQRRSVGLIAQEVEKVFPHLVTQEPDGSSDLKGINYSGLSVVNIQAIKELKAEIDALKAEIAALKSGQK